MTTHQHIGPRGTITCDAVHAERPFDLVPRPAETFSWGAWVWDVDSAAALIEASPRPPSFISVAPWTNLLGAMRVYPEHAVNADLSRPLIAVPFLGSWMIIDGWHRIWRADHDGVERLAVHLLSEAEERQVRTSTGGGGDHRQTDRRGRR